MAVGETHELAPRDPDPEGTYDWSVADAPEESDVAFGEDPIAYITPDEPGTYTVRLDAPDGTHELTVRVYPSDKSVTHQPTPIIATRTVPAWARSQSRASNSSKNRTHGARDRTN